MFKEMHTNHMECDICWQLVSGRIQNLTSTHTYWRAHTHGWTHTDTLKLHMNVCVHSHMHTVTCISDAYDGHIVLAHTHAHTPWHAYIQYTHWVCTSHTHMHTHSLQVGSFWTFCSLFACRCHSGSIHWQRRESRGFSTVRWRNSVTVTVRKVAVNSLSCYF